MQDPGLLRTARRLNKDLSNVTDRAYYRELCSGIAPSLSELRDYVKLENPPIILLSYEYPEMDNYTIGHTILASGQIVISTGGIGSASVATYCLFEAHPTYWRIVLTHASESIYTSNLFKPLTGINTILDLGVDKYGTPDPLTCHNIYVRRGDCMKINPDYAIEGALRGFDTFVSMKQGKRTPRAQVELFTYLLSLTWVFNISSNDRLMPLDVVNRDIPLNAEYTPDPNDPIMIRITKYNDRLISIYRSSIRSLYSIHPSHGILPNSEYIPVYVPDLGSTSGSRARTYTGIGTEPPTSISRRELIEYVKKYSPRVIVSYLNDYQRDSQDGSGLPPGYIRSSANIMILSYSFPAYLSISCSFRVLQDMWRISFEITGTRNIPDFIVDPRHGIYYANRFDPLTYHNIYSMRQVSDDLKSSNNDRQKSSAAQFSAAQFSAAQFSGFVSQLSTEDRKTLRSMDGNLTNEEFPNHTNLSYGGGFDPRTYRLLSAIRPNVAHEDSHVNNPDDLPHNPSTEANDIARELTLANFNEIISQSQSRGTLMAEVELYVYLISLTWCFNIPIPKHLGQIHLYSDTDGLPTQDKDNSHNPALTAPLMPAFIPLLPTNAPDPDNPIIQKIIECNHYLIPIYRNIISTLMYA